MKLGPMYWKNPMVESCSRRAPPMKHSSGTVVITPAAASQRLSVQALASRFVALLSACCHQYQRATGSISSDSMNNALMASISSVLRSMPYSAKLDPSTRATQGSDPNVSSWISWQKVQGFEVQRCQTPAEIGAGGKRAAREAALSNAGELK